MILAESSEVDIADLPDMPQASNTLPTQLGSSISLAQLEAEHIRLVVAKTRSREEAAAILGIDPATLYRKRKRMEAPEQVESEVAGS